MSQVIKTMKRNISGGVKKAIKIEKRLESAAARTAKSARHMARDIFTQKNNKIKPSSANNQPMNRKQTARKHKRGRGNTAFKPQFSNTKDGLLIRNREVIQTVTGYGAWSLSYVQNISAQNVLMMPWLASFAKKFDMYRIRKLSLHYKSRLGTAVSGSGVQGSTQMAIVYDADDPQLTTYAAMMDQLGSVEKVAHQDNSISFHPDRALFSEYFVSHGGSEVDFTSPATMYFSTYGFAATTANIGNLYVEYEVELRLPRVEASSPLAQTFLSAAASGSSPGNAFATLAGSGLNSGTAVGAICSLSSGWLDIYMAQPGKYNVVVTMVAAAAYTTTLASTTPWNLINTHPMGNFNIGGSGGQTVLVSSAAFEITENPSIWARGHINSSSNAPDCRFAVSDGNGGGASWSVYITIQCWGALNPYGTTILPLSSHKPTEQEVEDAMFKRLQKRLNSSKDEVDESSTSSNHLHINTSDEMVYVQRQETGEFLIPKLSVQSRTGSQKK